MLVASWSLMHVEMVATWSIELRAVVGSIVSLQAADDRQSRVKYVEA